MNGKPCVLLLLTLSLLFVPRIYAQESYNIDCVTQYYHNWSDVAFDVAVQGEFAYLACWTDGVRIVNVGDIQAPADVAHIEDGSANCLLLSGNRLFVGLHQIGIQVYDITTPAQPTPIAMIPRSDYLHCMKIKGDYLFVGSADVGIAIYDIEDLTNIVPVWSSDENAEICEIDLQGDFLYLACRWHGFKVFDITDIHNPVLSGEFSTSGGNYVMGASIAGNYAYLASGWNGLEVLDLTTLQVVAAIDSLNYGFATEVVGNIVYVHYGDPECPLALVDITNPLSPQTLSIYYPPEELSKFDIVGDLVYVADMHHGLRFVDVSDPANAFEAARYNRYGKDLDVTLADGIAYVREEYNLKLIDVSDPQSPRELGYYETPWGFRDMEIVGDLGYIVRNGYECLFAVDVSDPGAPTEIGSFTTADTDVHYRLAVYDHHAYIQENSGVRIVDISDPANMQQVGYLTVWIGNSQIETSNGRLFIETGNEQVQVYSLATPAEPVYIGAYSCGDNYCADLLIKNDLLLAVTPNVCYIYDASTSSNWDAMVEIPIPDIATSNWRSVDVQGDFVYLTAYPNGIYIYSIADLEHPTMVGSYRTPGRACGLAASGNLCYVADEDNFGIYDCSAALTATSANEPIAPQSVALLSNYPNPFNASTEIQFEIPVQSHVTLAVFDLLGRQVATLANAEFTAGGHTVNWNAGALASGRYFVRMAAGEQVSTRPVMLLK